MPRSVRAANPEKGMITLGAPPADTRRGLAVHGPTASAARRAQKHMPSRSVVTLWCGHALEPPIRTFQSIADGVLMSRHRIDLLTSPYRHCGSARECFRAGTGALGVHRV